MRVTWHVQGVDIVEVDARVDLVGGRIPSQDQAEYGLKVSLWIRPWIKGVHEACAGADPAEGGAGGTGSKTETSRTGVCIILSLKFLHTYALRDLEDSS